MMYLIFFHNTPPTHQTEFVGDNI